MMLISLTCFFNRKHISKYDILKLNICNYLSIKIKISLYINLWRDGWQKWEEGENHRYWESEVRKCFFKNYSFSHNIFWLCVPLHQLLPNPTHILMNALKSWYNHSNSCNQWKPVMFNMGIKWNWKYRKEHIHAELPQPHRLGTVGQK